MILILLVAIVVLVLVVSFAKNAFKYTKFSYITVKDELLNAAKNYGKNHKDKLPLTTKNYLELTDDFLKSEGYFKGYDKLYDDNVSCKGYVDVFRDYEDVYTYIAYLKCNDTKGQTIYEKVLEDNDYGVTEGTGLYALYKGKFITNESKLNDSNIMSKAWYVFRGSEIKNMFNYVKIGGMFWRILEIDENGDLILMYDSTFKSSYIWDNRYNGEFKDYSGINDYYKDGLKSEIASSLYSFYLGTIPLSDGSQQQYSHIIQMISLPMDLCIGKRTAEDEGYDGSIECSEKLKEQDIGLLPAYMYMRASLDEKCTTITSRYCNNYNYLSDYGESYWLLTTSSEPSNSCLYVKQTISSAKCNSKNAVKPIIKIPGDLELIAGADGGIGSMAKPYRIDHFYTETISYKKK